MRGSNEVCVESLDGPATEEVTSRMPGSQSVNNDLSEHLHEDVPSVGSADGVLVQVFNDCKLFECGYPIFTFIGKC
jgi:hypothetical protein